MESDSYIEEISHEASNIHRRRNKRPGSFSTTVSYKGQEEDLPLLVVEGYGPSLLGRNWLSRIKLDWKEINLLRSGSTKLQTLLQKCSNVFKTELGIIRGSTVDLPVSPDAKPKFLKARTVPYILKEKIETELDRLLSQGVIEPVKFAKWAAPIVPVVKADGTVRICGDYKLTINQVSSADSYPLPRIEDLFASLSGGKRFSKLDLSHAYQQLVLNEQLKQFTTINTHRGLYQYTHLPFGISCAPAVFQRTMDNLLKGIKHVSVYIDDIVVTGITEEEHLKNLDEVLSRLDGVGARLRKEKCSFFSPQIEYLGHLINEKGLHPTPSKIKAIIDAPAPPTVTELKSFLGLLNYYCKFLPYLSSTLHPLYSLLQKWGPEEKETFQKAKALLSSPRLLVHFDPEKKLVLSCDASAYGLGVVLSLLMEDGAEQPISYASCTLTSAVKKYSQLDKEALAIVYGVTKFHQYLYGRDFTLFTDHKPLTYLFSSDRAVPPDGILSSTTLGPHSELLSILGCFPPWKR